jgi:bifunctional non-homologous end joining protein LigD
MTFIPPMLCEVLRDPARLDDRRYLAEPKFDGQRAQIHVAGGRTAAAFSRRELDLLRHPGYAWLREVSWPVSRAVVDGELCGQTGSDGIQSVLEARGRRDGVTCFLAFDLLQVDGRDVMPEPWSDRRKRLEDLAATLDSARVAIIPVTDDAGRLWALWVGEQGGEGIVLKERSPPYRPGRRSSAWLKVKERLVIEVLVEDGNPELIRWGDWGWAARLRLTYTHPRNGIRGTIDELVRVPDPDNFELRRGAGADVLCWGILRPSGRLRHPVFVHWRETRG